MIVDLDELRRLELGDDDVLVLRLAHLPTPEECDRLAAELERIFPENRALILGPGADLEVITPTAATADALAADPTGGGVG